MRDLIYRVIESFYKKAINDVLIGYHFRKFENSEVLDKHLIRLTSFWEMQLTGQTSVPLDEGFRLLFTHYQLGLKRGELGRWIVLFHQTLGEIEKEIDHPNIVEFTNAFKERIAFFEQRFLQAPNLFK
jgi:truncated hemoglobin YjbI